MILPSLAEQPNKTTTVMSKKQSTKPENDPQRIEQLKKRRARYKTPEFREEITDAFHKAKLHALTQFDASPAVG